MPQSIALSMPQTISTGIDAPVTLVFGVALTDLSTLQYDIGSGTGFINVLPPNYGIVSATLAVGGLSAIIIYNSGSGFTDRVMRFKETVSGVISNSVPFVALAGSMVAKSYTLEINYPTSTPLQVVHTNGFSMANLTGSFPAHTPIVYISFEPGLVDGQLFMLVATPPSNNDNFLIGDNSSFTFSRGVLFMVWVAAAGQWYQISYS